MSAPSRGAVELLVAVYATSPDLPIRAPRRRLAAWRRLTLAPGERREVSFHLPDGLLAVWDVAAEAFRVQPGTYRIASGPSLAELTVGAELVVTGDAPPARRLVECGPDGLDAAAFHRRSAAITADRTREAGSCLELPPEAETGWARFDGIDLAGVGSFDLTLAPRRLAAAGESAVWLEARPAGEDDLAWRALTAPVTVPGSDVHDRAEAQYDWTSVAVAVTDGVADLAGAGPVDLRVMLTGAVRVASIAASR